MPLSPGTRFGSYEVLSSLGAGGMGEVYRARDSRLGREVAIKVVLEAFLSDRERLARFEREARALAALNHPNIATLHGMEEADGRHFLVMELVPGLTLGETLAAGPLALNHAIDVARQIAEGLEAAHEKGIVHRDLKPANVKITPDDKVKVLDFGLAKASVESNPSTVPSSMANSPTLTAMGTQAGMILGTASYMSPEQARGMSGDQRSDVFSFGVVLYEMLTGRQPFQGETVSDVLASVLARDPDLASLPPDLAPRLTDLVKRCLEKHPKRRWQAIGDVRFELEIIAQNPHRVGDPLTDSAAQFASIAAIPKPLWRRALPIAATGIAAGALTLVAVTMTRPTPAAPIVSRFVIPYAEGQERTVTSRTSMAISRDGTLIAYVANREIFIRNLADLEARLVSRAAATNLAATPFSLVFSPDGNSLAFWDQADQKIKRVEITGGATMPVCPADSPNGITWSGDHIYFTGQGGLYRVLASGGEPETIVKTNENDYLTPPQVMDDGRLLYSIAPPVEGATDRWGQAKIVLQRPGDAERTTLVEGGSDPRYLPSGHLVYQSGGVLFARTFDPRTGAVGGATSVVEGVLRGASNLGAGAAWYSVSSNGTMIYMPGPIGAAELDARIGWFDRAGKATFLPLPAGQYRTPRVSPDGKRIAFARDEAKNSAIWIYDLEASVSARRVTFGSRDQRPIWSSDSRWVIFQSDVDGSLYRQRADGQGTPERLTTAEKANAHIAQSVSRDGSLMLFDQVADRRATLMVYSFKDGKISPFGLTSMMPTGSEFSPDGRWIAYSMRETGQTTSTTYVQPYPATGAKYQISTSREDGHHQVWSADGKELFYTPGPGNLLTAIKITTVPSFAPGPGDPVERPFTNAPPQAYRPFDIGGPGVRFLGLQSAGVPDSSIAGRPEIRVVLNWTEELRSRVKQP